MNDGKQTQDYEYATTTAENGEPKGKGSGRESPVSNNKQNGNLV